MSSNYKLTYFNARGRAECIRMLFALGDQPYEDIRIKHEEWSQCRPRMPFHQLPVLEVDGVTICQSHAMERLVAKRFGFYGNSDLEQAKADMVVDCIGDVWAHIRQIRHAPEEDKTALRKKFEEEKLEEYLSLFDKMLNENGLFISEQVMWADITFTCLTSTIRACGINVDNFLKSFPRLQALEKKVETNPKIAAWIKKRPETAV